MQTISTYSAVSVKQNLQPRKANTNKVVFTFLLFVTLFVASAVNSSLLAQTKGLIVLPATGSGKAVLDPNGDGYVSQTNAGFINNDEAESEIAFRPIPMPRTEPLNDLERGPGGGFTDFSFVGSNINPVYTYTSAAGNLMFRFRLGGISPNSKGYSILIDTDGKFGNSGSTADPNYNSANPGFEVEVVLATNHGVYLYNVDGVAKPAIGSQVLTLPVTQYSQKAIAHSTQGGNADYFYDFYIPFSEITAKIPSFTAATQVRMVANTVMSPN
ncbi:MAG: hypothetical protein LPK19_03730, partial [Hymenobacteraceae bacterium]|nr:hypothetical protein [Hymenobacteraceae bacterium]MDX5395309.1 hypothetical protein [Hymenobacteraceae bacterium]MDX5511345.1 hypothetical protein [Hymenobacteraceae bacterium]